MGQQVTLCAAMDRARPSSPLSNAAGDDSHVDSIDTGANDINMVVKNICAVVPLGH